MVWIEEKTMDAWLELGTVTLHHVGAENTYATDDFGTVYFCKRGA